jgi:TetR/AcrR family transcriptional regulator, repressor for uid operon
MAAEERYETLDIVAPQNKRTNVRFLIDTMARTVNPSLHEERRRQILSAALACFRRRGFHSTTIAEICAEAGVSAGALYRYFPSKEEIIDAIGAQETERAQIIFTAIRNAPDPVAAMLSLTELLIAQFSDPGEGPLFAELLAEGVRNPRFQTRMQDMHRMILNEISTTIESGQATGKIDKSLDPGLAARVLMSMTDGVGLALVISASPDVQQDVRDALRDVIIRCLAPARYAELVNLSPDPMSLLSGLGFPIPDNVILPAGLKP